MSVVLKASDLDIARVVFGVPPKKVDDRYYFFASDDAGKNVYVQTPSMTVDAVSGDDKLKHVNLKTTDENLIRAVRVFDKQVSERIQAEKETWFPGKDITDAFLENAQTPSLAITDQGHNIKARVVAGDVKIFDHDKTETPDADFPESGSVKCILHFVGVWFTANRWGISWKVVQVKTAKKPRAVQTYLFTEDDDEPEDEYKSICPPPGYN